jgi:hypothetical protein
MRPNKLKHLYLAWHATVAVLRLMAPSSPLWLALRTVAEPCHTKARSYLFFSASFVL